MAENTPTTVDPEIAGAVGKLKPKDDDGKGKKKKRRERKPKVPKAPRERNPEAAANIAKAVPVIALAAAFLILTGIGVTTHQEIFLMGAIGALGVAVLLGIVTQERLWPVIGFSGMALIAIVGVGLGSVIAKW